MNTKNILKFIISIAICEFAGVVGALATMPAISNWYLFLNKPVLTPPSWVFGPVWTALYALMGISLYLVWKNNFKIANPILQTSKKPWNRWSQRLWTGDLAKFNIIAVFAVQYFFNVIWSWLFFGLRLPALGMLDILWLWFAIIYLIINFYRVSKPAAYLLIPYILWVTLAAYLNFAIWFLN